MQLTMNYKVPGEGSYPENMIHYGRCASPLMTSAHWREYPPNHTLDILHRSYDSMSLPWNWKDFGNELQPFLFCAEKARHHTATLSGEAQEGTADHCGGVCGFACRLYMYWRA